MPVLVATFGPNTEWAGKRIVSEGQVFVLEGHGSASAARLMEYDRQGQLVWTGDGVRAWVGSRALASSPPPLKLDTASSRDLQLARREYAKGKYRQALDSLRYVVPGAWTNADEARGLLELASAIRTAGDARLQDECDRLIATARKVITRLAQYASREELRQVEGLVAAVRACTVLGGHGLPLNVGDSVDVLFCTDDLAFLDGASGFTRARVPYADVKVVDIGGPGAQQNGGGFIGGGFGLEGAVTGMLVGAALNLLTTRTTINTVVCLRTVSAELYLHNSTEPPDSLRMRLSPAFVRLAQYDASRLTAVEPASQQQDSFVDQVVRLTDLHDAGKLTDEEFTAFKTKLMG